MLRSGVSKRLPAAGSDKQFYILYHDEFAFQTSVWDSQGKLSGALWPHQQECRKLFTLWITNRGRSIITLWGGTRHFIPLLQSTGANSRPLSICPTRGEGCLYQIIRHSLSQSCMSRVSPWCPWMLCKHANRVSFPRWTMAFCSPVPWILGDLLDGVCIYNSIKYTAQDRKAFLITLSQPVRLIL